MSKRYVIQVYVVNDDNGTLNAWQNVQHPSGSDWMTRSRSTAIADAAKLVNAGETRELRIGVSRPVYSVTPDVDMEQIVAAAAEINFNEADDDEDTDVDDDAIFEIVTETDPTDPDAPQLI